MQAFLVRGKFSWQQIRYTRRREHTYIMKDVYYGKPYSWSRMELTGE